MDKQAIENEAVALQRRLWRERDAHWPRRVFTPTEILDPVYAAKVLGIDFQYHPEIPAALGSKIAIAGLIDRQAGKIMVSQKFRREVVRFTGAHELGHWQLHSGVVIHRDRPLDGSFSVPGGQSWEEREANYFAACYLLPRKLLEQAFKDAFMVADSFVFDDASAFHLAPDDPDSVLRPEAGSHARGLALASAETYSGQHFHSLAKQFHVSVTAMAIRLEEIGVIRD